MHTQELLTIIQDKLDLSRNFLDFEVDQLTVRFEESTNQSIVFYYRHNSKRSDDKFFERIEQFNYGLVITNIKCPKSSPDDRIAYTSEDNFLLIQNILLNKFYPLRLNDFKIVGITGTNGKSTCVHLLNKICLSSNIPSISIGTLGVCCNVKDVSFKISNTTPAYLELHKIFYQFQSLVDVFFLEVSSHALVQDRLYSFRLDAAGWTNLTQDHLDYHKTFQEYFFAKAKIVKKLKNSKNLYIPYGEDKLNADLVKNKIDLKVSDNEICRELIQTPFFQANYNQKNLSLSLALFKNVFPSVVLETKKLQGLLTPPLGRFDIISYGKQMSVIDYAHTPDALENILKSLREDYLPEKLTVVFGCGGDRDRDKRPLMGEVAAQYCDKVFITSDNPRSEDPLVIINDIIGKNVFKEVISNSNRFESISRAINEQVDGEIILIAGKGHENYQEISGVKYPFNDRETVLSLITSV